MSAKPKMHLRAEPRSRDTLCGLLADPGGPRATDNPAEVTCRSCLKNHGDIDRAARATPPAGPILSLTAENLALLSDEQLEETSAAVDRLQQLVSADKRRRRDELAAKFEVLGRDATATCLRHRRTVRWMAAPTWWYHDPGAGHPEYRQCAAMLEAPAPLVWVDSDGRTMRGTGYLPPMVKLANRLAAKRGGE